MSSLLIVTPVEALQNEINSAVSSLNTAAGIYISLNKTQKSAESALREARADTNKLFFIDCVASQQTKDDVIHIKPTDLDTLTFTINAFIKEIKTTKYVLIDSLATLLVYNNTKKVVQFVKKLTEYASQNNVQIIALSQETTGENLLNTIFNFFDKVKK